MKSIKQRFALYFIVFAATFIGLFKGAEAKQKWVFKIKDKYINRKQMAEQKSIAKKGGVLLDDIELSSYHR